MATIVFYNSRSMEHVSVAAILKMYYTENSFIKMVPIDHYKKLDKIINDFKNFETAIFVGMNIQNMLPVVNSKFDEIVWMVSDSITLTPANENKLTKEWSKTTIIEGQGQLLSIVWSIYGDENIELPDPLLKCQEHYYDQSKHREFMSFFVKEFDDPKIKWTPWKKLFSYYLSEYENGSPDAYAKNLSDIIPNISASLIKNFIHKLSRHAYRGIYKENRCLVINTVEDFHRLIYLTDKLHEKLQEIDFIIGYMNVKGKSNVYKILPLTNKTLVIENYEKNPVELIIPSE